MKVLIIILMRFDIPKSTNRENTIEWLTSYNLKPILQKARQEDNLARSFDFERYRNERKTVTTDWFTQNLTKNQTVIANPTAL